MMIVTNIIVRRNNDSVGQQCIWIYHKYMMNEFWTNDPVWMMTKMHWMWLWQQCNDGAMLIVSKSNQTIKVCWPGDNNQSMLTRRKQPKYVDKETIKVCWSGENYQSMLTRRKAGESASAKADECQAKVVILQWLSADNPILYQTIWPDDNLS